MTKDEYAKLLSSDYWKGYSYSLIKERNFTCEDCGKQFLNERNKLQVHHLVYRDIYPWSYKPEELVVLCRECHEKRHGIVSKPEQQTQNEQPAEFGNYTKSYSSTNYDNQDRPVPSYQSGSSTSDFDSSIAFAKANEEFNRRRAEYYESQKRNTKNKGIAKYVLVFILLFFAFLAFIMFSPFNNDRKEFVEDVDMIDSLDENDYMLDDDVPLGVEKSKGAKSNGAKRNVENMEASVDEILKEEDTKELSEEKSALEILEERNHANIVRQAKKAGVSTEGSTLEIMERINHANIVKQAKEAGVSTEGSTLEIMERINHANIVKQAKEAGVSTEGSTLEIMERINHANIVKQAKEAGVSTEGSTLEIMERINRKYLERY